MINSSRWLSLGSAFLIAAGMAGLGPAAFAQDLVARGSEWRYQDDGSDQGTAWRELDFADSTWPHGPGQLGYGDGDEKTVVGFGTDKNNKFVTTYFRHTFTVADPAPYQKITSIGVQAMCDDGCVVYLNGKEVARFNLPAGTIGYRTFATTAADGARESQYLVGAAPASLLRQGKNVVAVEVHQQRPSSSDISFDLQRMSTAGPPPAPAAPAAVSGLDSAALILQAAQVQRSEALRGALKLISDKIASDKARGDTTNLARLAEVEEDLTIELHGAGLPNFLRKPARIVMAQSSKTIRFVAFGDFGIGSAEQKAVAGAIKEEHRKSKLDFGITLGDNFYGSGLSTPDDERWISQWEDLYSPLGVPFFASLGNHDWYNPDSPASEILYSQKSKSWRIPSIYYSFTAGPVEFFALNTEVLTEKQLKWLRDGLEHSTAKWKVVYGHHPPFSPGSHGDDPALAEKLMPVLKGRADVFLAGHDHILAHVKAQDGVELFVSGGGGASSYSIDSSYTKTAFAQPTYGFLEVEASQTALKFTFIGIKGQELYSYTLKK